MTEPRSDGPAVHPRLDALFRGFDHDRLAWCLLRGETDLEAPAGDIDVLVAPGHAERLRAVAGGLGFARLPAPGHASHVFLIAFDEPTATWLKLDVVTELAFGPSFAFRLPSVVTGSCLDRRRRVGSAYGLDPRDAFWARLLHGLLDKPRIEAVELVVLAGLAEAGLEGGPLAKAVGRMLPAGWSTDRVVDAVERTDRPGLELIAAGLARAWRRRSPVGTTARRIDATVRRRAGRVARVRSPRGLDVVLVGDADLTGQVAAGLRATVPLPVRIIAGGRAGTPVATRVRHAIDVGSGLVVRCVADAPALPGSSARPDLVIVFDRTGGPGASGGAGDRRPGDGSWIRTVDAAGPEAAIQRAVAGLVWAALAERWPSPDLGGRG